MLLTALVNFMLFLEILLLSPLSEGLLDRREVLALQELYAKTGGDLWTHKTNWLVSSDPCSRSHPWYGILCDHAGEHVNAILLTANNLRGTIPDSIGHFSELTEISFNGNDLSGPIPSSFANLVKLYAVGMTFNHLSGPLPEHIGNLKNLRFLHLDFNNLTGPVPESFYELANLDYAGFYGNNLSGSLSSEGLKKLTSVNFLCFSHNKLSGPFPDVSGLQDLQVLGLAANDFSGVVPAFRNNPTLKEIQLQLNRAAGPIPSLQSIPDAIFFMLYGNQFKGRIPDDIQNLNQLVFLDLHDNFLSGTLPTWLMQFSQDRVDLSNNPFSCPIPSWASFTHATCKPESYRLTAGRELKGAMFASQRDAWRRRRSEANEKRVQVEIFGMAKCPDMKSIEAVFGHLLQTQRCLPLMADLRVNFIGKVQETEPTGIYSMHGQTEALGELFQICVANHFGPSDVKSYFEFLECVNVDQQSIPSNIRGCATEQKLDYDSLLACALSSQTRKDLQDIAKRSEAIGAVWSPTIYMNGVEYCLWDSFPCGASKPEDFVKEICRLYQGPSKPPCCSHIKQSS